MLRRRVFLLEQAGTYLGDLAGPLLILHGAFARGMGKAVVV